MSTTQHIARSRLGNSFACLAPHPRRYARESVVLGVIDPAGKSVLYAQLAYHTGIAYLKWQPDFEPATIFESRLIAHRCFTCLTSERSFDPVGWHTFTRHAEDDGNGPPSHFLAHCQTPAPSTLIKAVLYKEA